MAQKQKILTDAQIEFDRKAESKRRSAFDMRVRELVDHALALRLQGLLVGGIGASAIERDGRLVKRACAELIKAGLLIAHSDGNGTTYSINAATVLATVEPVKPTFTIDDRDAELVIEGRRPIGTMYAKFTARERLYLLDHAGEYRWFWVWNNDKEVDWAPGQERPDRSWHGELFVSDRATRDELGMRVREAGITRLMKQNVGWAVEHLAGCSEETAKAFVACGSVGFGHHDDFDGAKPATWEAKAAEYLSRAEGKLNDARAKVEAARLVVAKVNEAGGWQQLAAHLRVKVEASLDGKESK